MEAVMTNHFEEICGDCARQDKSGHCPVTGDIMPDTCQACDRWTDSLPDCEDCGRMREDFLTTEAWGHVQTDSLGYSCSEDLEPETCTAEDRCSRDDDKAYWEDLRAHE